MDIRTDATKADFLTRRRLVQQQLRKMRDTWMVRKATVIQGYADRIKMRNFFKAIQAIYGPCIKGTAPQIRSDGTTQLTEKSEILKRWAEHFRSILNFSLAISDSAVDRFPQVDRNEICRLPYQNPSKPCNRFSVGKHRDPTRSHKKSTSTMGLD
ncbi:unnamed protein product [Schistocephalus solidus]|uniref:Reverse transcriptase domain-containing protein n=1 Tax=Schistocephalus solidus TaxID=70667 RepID=A0A183SXQ5_SCHSO|nr:unnamed protein product [Schistocephalus solidus]